MTSRHGLGINDEGLSRINDFAGYLRASAQPVSTLTSQPRLEQFYTPVIATTDGFTCFTDIANVTSDAGMVADQNYSQLPSHELEPLQSSFTLLPSNLESLHSLERASDGDVTQKAHPFLDSQDVSPDTLEQARSDLYEHMRQRLPGIKASSQRLHDVTSVYNEEEFQLPPRKALSPLGPLRGSPNLRHLRTGQQSNLHSTTNFHPPEYNFYEPPTLTQQPTPAPELFEQFPSARSEPSERRIHPLLLHPALAMPPSAAARQAYHYPQTTPQITIDPIILNDNRSLREVMLEHGAQPYANQVKRELMSITFNDYSTQLGSGTWRNEMLGHFRAGENGCRILMYELDIPIAPQAAGQNPQFLATTRWLWFYLAIPIIDTSRLQSGASAPLGEGSIPFSSLVFAAPWTTWIPQHESHAPGGELIQVECIKLREDLIESNTFRQHSRSNNQPKRHRPQRAIPNSLQSPKSSNEQVSTQTISIHRRDYDLSNYGIPSFEFSTNNPNYTHRDRFPALFGMNSLFKDQEFLVAKLQNHHFNPATTAQRQERLAFLNSISKPPHSPPDFTNTHTSTDQHPTTPDSNTRSDPNYTQHSTEQPHFWDAVQNAAFEDVMRWRKIRDAMARGCCRVITREEVVTDVGGEGGGRGEGREARARRKRRMG